MTPSDEDVHGSEGSTVQPKADALAGQGHVVATNYPESHDTPHTLQVIHLHRACLYVNRSDLASCL